MIRNFLTVAIRTFLRNKAISLIHVLGLSIGISASLIIFLIVRYEFSFDKFEPDKERIYRVVMDFNFNGTEGHGAAVPAPLANAVEHEVTGVEETVPLMQFQGEATADVMVAGVNSKQVVFKNQADIIFTNGPYFKVLPYTWIVGSPESALEEPFSVVLSESRAHQYFPGVGLSEMLGKQITYNGEVTASVTGIVKDLREATDLSSMEFISYSTISQTRLRDNFMMNVWDDWMAYSTLYVKLGAGNDKGGVEGQLNQVLKKYSPKMNGDTHSTMAFALQPLGDVHFDPNYAGFKQRIANKQTLSGLLAIAGFLLILGCINFTNLSTAQASRRAKEIGIRKSVGSSRKLLVLQFLSETFCITALATLVSTGIAPLLMEVFNDFISPGVALEASDPQLFVFLFFITIVVTILSGIYPAMILSGFRPARILRNQADGPSTRSAGIRKVLTVSQFVVAQFFIIAAFMVAKQIHFSLNQDLGYRKEAIITFSLPRDTVADHRERIRNEIEGIPGVQLVSLGFLPPAMEGAAFGNIIFKRENGEEVKENVQVRWGDPNYITLYKIGLVAGRNIRGGKNVDEVLINETYARDMGFIHPRDALEKELSMGNGSKSTIVGIMRDFHEGSLRAHIGPIAFKARDDGNFFHIALTTQNVNGPSWQNAIQKIEKIFLGVYPGEEFEYAFFDDTIAKFYVTEQRMSRLLNWAMGLSVLISCLGLLGLVMYTAETRTKEIGIRKILGATVSDLISILSFEFIRLVMIAFLIAAPLAWWSMDEWLGRFAYRTSMSWWVFGVSGLLLIAIAMVTITAQTLKTATENPVKSLRAE